MLAGDWTAFNNCYRPNWRDPDLAAGRINPARYSPVALAITAKLPRAENDCGELRWGARSERHDKQIVTRFDYQHNPEHVVLRALPRHAAQGAADLRRVEPADGGTGTQAENNWAHQYSFGHDWVLGPTAVNSLRVAHSRIITDRFGAEFFNARDVGINAYTTVPNAFQFNVDGHFGFGNGMAYTQAWQNQYQIANHVDLIRGEHQFGFGVDWARDDILSYSNTFGVGNMNVGPDRTGNAMGDFLLGHMTQIRQAMPGLLSPVQHYVGVYAQDTWRATPRLTLNYGVRWEPFLPFDWIPSGPTGGVRVYSFSLDDFKAGKKSVVFPNAPAGFAYPSQNDDGSGPADFEGASAIKRRLNQFAPRVGAAWDPDRLGPKLGPRRLRHDVRAGAAERHARVQRHLAVGGGPAPSPRLAGQPVAGAAGRQPVPVRLAREPAVPAVLGPAAVRSGPEHAVHAQLERLLPAGARRPLARVGQLPGEPRPRLWGMEALNPVINLTPQSHANLFTGPNTCVLEGQTFTPCNTAANLNERRELRLWANQNGTAQQREDVQLVSNIDMWRSDRTSSYHGLLTSVRGDIAGIDLNVNYTLSKCTSDRVTLAIANPNGSPQNLETKDRAPCQQDRRHIYNMTAIASTPQFDNPRAARAGVGLAAGRHQPHLVGRAADDSWRERIGRSPVSPDSPRTASATTSSSTSPEASARCATTARRSRCPRLAPTAMRDSSRCPASAPGRSMRRSRALPLRRPPHRGAARGVQRAERGAREQPDRRRSRT